MESNKSQTRTTNPIINIILVFSVGLSALEIAQLIFDPSNTAALTSLEFSQVFDSMYESMFLSADSLSSFWAVLIAWAISGMIAGVRAKHGFFGAFAGFLGTLLGSGLLLIAHFSSAAAIEVANEFIFGVIAATLVTTVAAYATGTATKPKKVEPKYKKTRKAWDASKTKEVWTCNRCGTKLPPGAFSCPSCGEPVIE
jgi:multisubunit Na+/H+ antiporter MnhG subunit